MDAAIQSLDVSAYRIPTEAPESDGTLEWSSTTLVVVEVVAGSARGLGYTYAGAAAATLIRDRLREIVVGRCALDVPALWGAMVSAMRNEGRPGIVSRAISAVDAALWDAKGRLLNLPVVRVLGAAREGIPAYGSGGFTSYSVSRLQEQISRWVENGLAMVKMKVGRHPRDDLGRIRAAREAAGDQTDLFIDANGAYSCKQALDIAERAREYAVSWFEEPVSSDNLQGLRLVREHGPAGQEVAAGEYGCDVYYFREMLQAGAVDVLQADATRCGGITGFLAAAAVSNAFEIPFSAHTAPALHTHPCCSLTNARHVEYFHDHARIEEWFFDGAPRPIKGILHPDLSRPGLGLELKRDDARPYLL